jgi:hypothetical protein
MTLLTPKASNQESVDRYVLESTGDAVYGISPLSVHDVTDSMLSPYFTRGHRSDPDPAGRSRTWTVALVSHVNHVANAQLAPVPTMVGYDVCADLGRRLLAAQVDLSDIVAQSNTFRRLLRAVARRLAHQRGFLPFHGALLGRTRDGRGIAILGAKRAGKTSTVLASLAYGAFSYLANDDIMIGPGPCASVPICGLGSPRSVHIRQDILGTFSQLDRPALGERTVRTPDGWSLLPQDLCAAMDATTGVSAAIHTLIFPRFVTGIRYSRLVPIDDESRRRRLIREHLQTTVGQPEQGLDKFFYRPGTTAVTDGISLLTQLTSAYELHQDGRTLVDSADLLAHLDA